MLKTILATFLSSLTGNTPQAYFQERMYDFHMPQGQHNVPHYTRHDHTLVSLYSKATLLLFTAAYYLLGYMGGSFGRLNPLARLIRPLMMYGL